MSETTPPPLEVRKATDAEDDSEGKLVEYDIVLGRLGIGNATLQLDRALREVSIDWISIDKEKRGHGYGKQARVALIKRILGSYRWADKITSTTETVPALRSVISTPVPEGWTRIFLLSEGRGTSGNGDRLFEFTGQTEDPQEALTCMELGGSVTTYIEKAT